MIWAISILSIAVICLVAVNVIDYFWHRRIEDRLDKLDGATLNNMRREKNINHEDLLK
jgi:hypothetical protein